jgi:hypothetical protein
LSLPQVDLGHFCSILFFVNKEFSMIFKLTPCLITRLASPLLIAASLSACSGMQRVTARLPSDDAMAALPTIKLGQPKPAQGDYVVYLPASEPVAASATVQGSLFEKTESKALHVKLKQDLYLYKHWVSFDRRNWVPDTDAVGGNIRVALPSYDNPKAGEVLIELNAKR